MKIIFICGGAEPGKDGVGDYSRLLASELIKQGCEVEILAIADRTVSAYILENQSANGVSVQVARIPYSQLRKDTTALASEFIRNSKPDLVSIQFVPYSYNFKGLPLGLPKLLFKITKGIPKHIMFHELWLEDAKFKTRIIALIQKGIISRLYTILKPIVIHTHVPAYKSRLLSLGIKVNTLSIFSNIPKIDSDEIETSGKFIAGIFSQITYRAEIEDLLMSLYKTCEEKGLGFELRLIGGSAARAKNFIDEIKFAEVKKHIVHTGFLDEKNISLNISECTTGITPVPRHLIGKSGSTIAFLSHGKPIIAPYDKPGFKDVGLGIFDEDLTEAVLKMPSLEEIRVASETARKFGYRFTPEVVSEIFFKDITNVLK